MHLANTVTDATQQNFLMTDFINPKLDSATYSDKVNKVVIVFLNR